jgi:CheY-like chemotaxis protein
VADGPGLRKALTSWQPDLIVCPFSLQRLDGFEALEISREQAPAVPFLFRAGSIGEGRASEARRRGAYDAVDRDDYDRFLQLVSQVAENNPSR